MFILKLSGIQINRLIVQMHFLCRSYNNKRWRNQTQKQKKFCILESFNRNNSHQLFDKTITFVNSQHKNTIQKVIQYSKIGFKCSFERFLVYKNKSDSKIYILVALFPKSSLYSRRKYYCYHQNTK